MRRNFVLGALVAVAITAVWYLFLFSPQVNRANDARTALDAERANQQTLEARRQELTLLADQQFAYANGIAQLAASIPLQPDEAALIESIYTLAAENRITLQAVSPSPPSVSADGTFYEIPVTISATGTYFDLLSFLFAVEELERLVRIDNVDLSYQPPSSEVDPETGLETNVVEGGLTISLSGAAFSQAPLPGGVVVEPTDEAAAETEATEGAATDDEGATG